MAIRALSERELKFCRNMLTAKDQSEAAIQSGYSPKAARQIASRLLTKANIKAEIKRLREKAEKNALVTRERIEQELAALAFADMGTYVEVLEGGIVKATAFKDLPPGATRVIKSVKEHKKIMTDSEGDGSGIVVDNEFEFSLHDKLGALKELSKLKGLYPKDGTGEEIKRYVFQFGGVVTE